LTTKLLPLMPADGRVVNLSSAAQAPVDFQALSGNRRLSDSDAYAQSKLGITMWTFYLANTRGSSGPVIVAVNPASFLGSKMVKEAYGTAGNDLSIGAYILFRAALDSQFKEATGRYFDNDTGQFSTPHPDAMNASANRQLITEMDNLIASLTHG
ncbi:MAG: oxidoreductase, partial [Pseudomonadota bacterium]